MCEQAVLVFFSAGKSTPFELSAKRRFRSTRHPNFVSLITAAQTSPATCQGTLPIKAAAEKSQSINSESIRAVYNEKSVVLPQNPNKFFASRPSEHTQHRRVMARMNIVRIQCASRK